MKSTIALIALTVLSTSALALPPMMMAADLGVSQEADESLTGVATKDLLTGDKFIFPAAFQFKKTRAGNFAATLGVDVCKAEISSTTPDLNVVQLNQALEWKVISREDGYSPVTGDAYVFTLASDKAPGRIMKMTCDQDQKNLSEAISRSEVTLARGRKIERINYEGDSFGKQARIRLDGEIPDGSIERKPIWDGIQDPRRPGGGRPGTR